MEIKYDDDLRQCKYCGRYGHLIGKCRTKARDDERHQHHRNETATWIEQRQALTAECTTEGQKLQQHYEEETIAISDVQDAALISIEGTADYEARHHHLTEAYQEDLDELQSHYSERLCFLDDDIAARKDKLDTQYRWGHPTGDPDSRRTRQRHL